MLCEPVLCAMFSITAFSCPSPNIGFVPALAGIIKPRIAKKGNIFFIVPILLLYDKRLNMKVCISDAFSGFTDKRKNVIININ